MIFTLIYNLCLSRNSGEAKLLEPGWEKKNVFLMLVDNGHLFSTAWFLSGATCICAPTNWGFTLQSWKLGCVDMFFGLFLMIGISVSQCVVYIQLFLVFPSMFLMDSKPDSFFYPPMFFFSQCRRSLIMRSLNCPLYLSILLIMYVVYFWQKKHIVVQQGKVLMCLKRESLTEFLCLLLILLCGRYVGIRFQIISPCVNT